MARPTSFRLPDPLLVDLDAEARAAGVSVTALVSTLLDEGIKTRRFPGIVYRDGATGRRAALVGGPDVWEVIRDLAEAEGSERARLAEVADAAGLDQRQVETAVDFYVAHPDAIDQRIAADAGAAKRVRAQIDRRERLLSS